MNKTVFLLIFLSFSCNENELVLKKSNPDLNLRSKQATYKNDFFTGTIIEISKDNDTVLRGKYKNGYKSDKWTSFYENGNVKEIRFYNKGKKTGLFRGFYKNGLIKFEYSFKNDEYHGEGIYSYSDGMTINGKWKESCKCCKHLHDTFTTEALSDIIGTSIESIEIDCNLPKKYNKC